MKKYVVVAVALCMGLAIFAFWPAPIKRLSNLPLLSATPGVRSPAVTQSNLHSTICSRNYVARITPSSTFLETVEKEELHGAYANDSRLAASKYQENYLIPLQLGGSPTAIGNMWPMVRSYRWDAHRKHDVEHALNRLVCRGQLTLADAQRIIVTNWIVAYHLYVSK